ncbi:hypothetical protein AMJ57_03060 [Parcubacteria bacterium SG8_24]|nr:MAG: hypothetical protein AMJ57_03060 [Parcubacteria bacterium SG8_24]
MQKLSLIGISLLATLIALIPTWLYILARLLLEPDGFWQEVVVLGLGVWVLGGIQIMLLIFLIYFLVSMWSD